MMWPIEDSSDFEGHIPRVSVLLPVFNAQRYVEISVRSVLSQTYRDFEFLIVDDGSTDDSLTILRKIASEDRRIRLISRPNAGLVVTLNEMLSLARGELLARMDADDICQPTRFERQCAYLDAHPECVALGSRSLFIDPEGLPIFEFIDRYTHDEINESLLKPEIGMLHPSVMLRSDAVRLLGGYRSAYPHVEDLDLFLRLGEVGRLANLPDVLLSYRVHSASVSHQSQVEQSLAGRRAVEAALKRRGVNAPTNTTLSAPLATSESRAQLHRKWAWWALSAGNLQTARKHSVLGLSENPLNGNSLKLFVCVVRDSLKALL